MEAALIIACAEIEIRRQDALCQLDDNEMCNGTQEVDNLYKDLHSRCPDLNMTLSPGKSWDYDLTRFTGRLAHDKTDKILDCSGIRAARTSRWVSSGLC